MDSCGINSRVNWDERPPVKRRKVALNSFQAPRNNSKDLSLLGGLHITRMLSVRLKLQCHETKASQRLQTTLLSQSDKMDFRASFRPTQTLKQNLAAFCDICHWFLCVIVSACWHRMWKNAGFQRLLFETGSSVHLHKQSALISRTMAALRLHILFKTNCGT